MISEQTRKVQKRHLRHDIPTRGIRVKINHQLDINGICGKRAEKLTGFSKQNVFLI